MSNKKCITIIGGGFAGLQIAKRLNNTDYDILLIDKVNYHQFQPLFYQVASAGLDPSNVSFPLRSIFHHSKNVRIRIAELQQIIPAENKITTSIGDFNYDYLVLANGATTNFFGDKNLEEKTFPMKSTVEALYLRYRILQNFEDALVASPGELEGLMNFVVVGGGPTGVELAGAIAEMKRHVLPKDYADFDFSKMRILLFEGSPKLLSNMSEQSSKKSKLYLEQLGVEVWVNARVKEYDGKFISLQDGKTVHANTVIWAAGVRGNIVAGLGKETETKGSRLKVDHYFRVVGYENIYAVGDVCFMATEKYPNGHPQLANAAIKQAKSLAQNFKNMLRNKPLAEFEYHNKGTLATVGKRKAVVDLPYLKFQGTLAWFVWLGVHLVLLMGMRNKVFVFIEWVNAYFTNDSTLRLIFRPIFKKKYLEQ